LPFSRTLGDELAHQVGVTSEAELTELVLEPQHRVVLLASSSVLELLTSAVRISAAPRPLKPTQPAFAALVRVEGREH